MDPLTQSITGSRSFPPGGTFEHWQGAPLKLVLSLASGALTDALQIIVEIHALQTVAATPLASLAHDIVDFDGPWTLEFSAAQMNQAVPESNAFRTLWLVIVALYPDGRVEPLATRSIKLHRSNYSGNIAAPPAVTQATIEALTARVEALEEGGGGGGGGSTNISITPASTSVLVASSSGTDGTIAAADGTNAGVLTAAMFTKLAGIATGATANAGDVVGPASAVSSRVAAFDGTTGKLLKDSTFSISGTSGSTLNIGTGGTLGTAAFTAATAYGAVAGTLAQFAATSSAQLRGVMSDETGTGALVFGTSPVFYGTPVLGDDSNAGTLKISGDPVTSGNHLTLSFLGSSGPQTWAFPDSSGTGATQEWVDAQTTTVGGADQIVRMNGSNIILADGGFHSGTANVRNGYVVLYGDSVAGSTHILSTQATADREWDHPDESGIYASREWVGQWAGSTNITSVGTVTSGTWSADTIAVNKGGTGRTSHTAYAVLCGGTTSTAEQQSIASVGTAGQVLTSNGAAALPTFQDAAGGSSSPIPLLSSFWG